MVAINFLQVTATYLTAGNYHNLLLINNGRPFETAHPFSDYKAEFVNLKKITT